jgi:hypothetical protein
MLYRYRLYEVDGSEAGEAHYALLIEAGEAIWTCAGRKRRGGRFLSRSVVATESMG